MTQTDAMAPSKGAGILFNEIAGHLYSARELLHSDDARAGHAAAVLVSLCGALADMGAKAHGSPAVAGNECAWLLSPAAADAARLLESGAR